jgi:hypothetical protein
MKVGILLTCGHIEEEKIETAIQLPNVGDERKCPQCGKIVSILKVSQPYFEKNK